MLVIRAAARDAADGYYRDRGADLGREERARYAAVVVIIIGYDYRKAGIFTRSGYIAGEAEGPGGEGGDGDFIADGATIAAAGDC